MRTLALYVAAGVVYVGVGVAYTNFLLASIVALGYLLLAVWLLPLLVRRLR